MMPTATKSFVGGRLYAWRRIDRSFALYWAAALISNFGSMVSLFAVPMTAITLLHATPAQVGYLQAAEILPTALFGILAGALADSCSKKRLMIIRDVGAGVSLVLIVAAYAAGFLHMALLLASMFVFGCFQVLGEVAESALLPELVKHKERLLQANSRLEFASSTVNLTAPGVAGWLMVVLSAPLVILCDAASYFASALFVAGISVPPAASKAEAPQRASFASIGAGLQAIARIRPVRGLVLLYLVFAFLFDLVIGLRILRAAEQLQISADVLGGLYMLSGVGGLAAASLMQRASDRFGLRSVMAVAALLCGVGCSLLSVVGPADAWKEAGVAASLLVTAFGRSAFLVAVRSALQLAVPADLLGRVRGAQFFAYAWLSALSGIVAGTLAEAIGVAGVIAIASAGLAILGGVGAPCLPEIQPSAADPDSSPQ